MNCSVYLFSGASAQHDQYPNDSLVPLFKRLVSLCTEPRQLVIHREGELVFYAYICLLEPTSREYFGFALLVNGEQVTGHFEQLLEFSEAQIQRLALEKTLLTLDDYGRLRRTEYSFASQLALLDRVVHHLRGEALALQIPLELLPPTNYSIEGSSYCTLPLAEGDNAILSATARYGVVAVVRNEVYQDSSLKQYSEQLNRLSTERDAARGELLTLKSEYDKLLRQKKQYKKVSILTLCVVLLVLIGLGGFFFLGYNLRLVQQDAKEQTSQKEMLAKRNEKLEQDNQELAYSYQREQQEHREARSLLEGLAQDMPIIIKGAGVATTSQTSDRPNDFSSKARVDHCLWIAIEYKELEEAAIDLRCDVYRAEDHYLMASVEIPLQTLLLGEGVRTVLSPGLVADWKEGSYRIEVLKGEQLVYSKPFRLI